MFFLFFGEKKTQGEGKRKKKTKKIDAASYFVSCHIHDVGIGLCI